MENKRRKSLTKRDLDLDAMASISEKNQEATETKDDDIATDTESRRIIRTGSRTGSASQSGDDRLEDVDRESEVRDDQEEEVEEETRTTNQRRVQERIVTGKIYSLIRFKGAMRFDFFSSDWLRTVGWNKVSNQHKCLSA